MDRYNVKRCMLQELDGDYVSWADYEQERRATLMLLEAVNKGAERLLELTKGSGSATYSAWYELDAAIAKMQEAFGIDSVLGGP